MSRLEQFNKIITSSSMHILFAYHRGYLPLFQYHELFMVLLPRIFPVRGELVAAQCALLTPIHSFVRLCLCAYNYLNGYFQLHIHHLGGRLVQLIEILEQSYSVEH